MSMIRTYKELSRLDTFKDRYDYLRLRGLVGSETFGYDRYLNQRFYSSQQWKRIRDHVIARDLGRDLGVEGYEIQSNILVHHMNPITPEEIQSGEESILDPEFLITTCHNTHNAIHYGDESLLPKLFVPRTPGDTDLW